ncbi:MAG: endonuclease/exonuclease/phosphatase family protein [Deltaproteobacteria bacterium]|nr:endonuclease/exonuclease/phosphatase family protein [Deltaproteobacteria bacterium]
MAAKNPEAPRQGKTLSLLSLNTGLLDLRVSDFLFFQRRDVGIFKAPYLEQRRRLCPQVLEEQDADFILLQEVWNDDDIFRLVAWGDVNGYVGHHRPFSQEKDGLLTLVRKELLEEGTDFSVEHIACEGEGFDWLASPMRVIRRRQVVHFSAKDAAR